LFSTIFNARVRRFDVIGIVGKILETKHDINPSERNHNCTSPPSQQEEFAGFPSAIWAYGFSALEIYNWCRLGPTGFT